jgi:hypothetical protein
MAWALNRLGRSLLDLLDTLGRKARFLSRVEALA